MKLSYFLIVPLKFIRATLFKMYLVSRTASFAKIFFLFSICGLIMYVVLAFYTFHVALTAVTSAEKIEQSLIKYPVPEIRKEMKRKTDYTIKYILLWTIPDFKYNLTADGQSLFVENDCEYTNCYLTTNKKLLKNDVKKFDAIVFSISTLRKWNTYLPKERSPKQKYVFYSMIPANENPVCNIRADEFFNWTWTYKLYSDISTPFIEVKDLKGDLVAPSIDVEWPNNLPCTDTSQMSTKSKTIMWFNERCDSVHPNIFAKELQMHLKEHSLALDIYGCGNKQCPKGGCLKAIEKDYSFYLAFENSLADDYVTKEVLKGFHHNAVPIVVGGADYSKFLPPNSYIDARYETPERLAGLLEYIVRNPSSYNKYFTWKNYYTINKANLQKGYCQLCALLNDKKRTETHSSYEVFRKWWYYGNLQKKCYPKGAESLDDVLSYIDNVTIRKSYMP